jgi:Flp pilus assembly protein TadD
MGDSAGADAETKQAEVISKQNASLQGATFATNSGKRLLSAGDVDGAISQFRTAIRLSPGYAPAHFQLAVALSRKGQKDESQQEFSKAAELDPKLKQPSSSN